VVGGDFNFFSSLGVFFCFLFCWSVLVGWLSESPDSTAKKREKKKGERRLHERARTETPKERTPAY